MFAIEPVSGALGGLVKDIDLCQPLKDNEIAFLKEALHKYQVLFFRDQPFDPDQHVRLARYFGDLQSHAAYDHVEGFPELTILENDLARPPKIEKWHSDMTFRPCPPIGSILHAIVIPGKGGDTMFSSMSAAFEALSQKMQSFLSELIAIHDFSHGFKESIAEPGGRDRLQQMIEDNPPVEHPVVRVHPETNKKGLYVNSLFTLRIKDMRESESRALLDFLFEHVALPEFTCRFKWETNSVAFWDNRHTQHKPVNDYWPGERRMQRITIEDGQRPF